MLVGIWTFEGLYGTYNLSLGAFKLLLTNLAGSRSKGIAALSTSFRGAISRTIFRNSQDNMAVSQVRTSLKGRGAAVITARGVIGSHPIATVVLISTVVFVGVDDHGGSRGLSGCDGRARGRGNGGNGALHGSSGRQSEGGDWGHGGVRSESRGRGTGGDELIIPKTKDIQTAPSKVEDADQVSVCENEVNVSYI